jgi:hypothetical protein
MSDATSECLNRVKDGGRDDIRHGSAQRQKADLFGANAKGRSVPNKRHQSLYNLVGGYQDGLWNCDAE